MEKCTKPGSGAAKAELRKRRRKRNEEETNTNRKNKREASTAQRVVEVVGLNGRTKNSG